MGLSRHGDIKINTSSKTKPDLQQLRAAKKAKKVQDRYRRREGIRREDHRSPWNAVGGSAEQEADGTRIAEARFDVKTTEVRGMLLEVLRNKKPTEQDSLNLSWDKNR